MATKKRLSRSGHQEAVIEEQLSRSEVIEKQSHCDQARKQDRPQWYKKSAEDTRRSSKTATAITHWASGPTAIEKWPLRRDH